MVELLEADDDSGAMLLERCLPGTTLRSQPESAQDGVIAAVLKRVWESTTETTRPFGFRHLSQMIDLWCRETIAQRCLWPDAGLVNEGLRVMKEFARPAPADVLLATDLHAGNVLRSQREPWLAIDPKPFVGDRSYDPVQHLINCETRHAVVRVSVDDVEGLGECKEICAWIRSGDPAHAAEVFAVENVAGNVPTKQTWLCFGDPRRNLREIGIRVMLGEKLVPAPRCAGAGIETKGLECVASLAKTWYGSRTTSTWSCRYVHHLAELSVSSADAYQLLFVFHMLPPCRLRGPGRRQTALPGRVGVVRLGSLCNKAKGRLWPPSGDLV